MEDVAAYLTRTPRSHTHQHGWRRKTDRRGPAAVGYRRVDGRRCRGPLQEVQIRLCGCVRVCSHGVRPHYARELRKFTDSRISAFSADVIAENQVDGKTLCDLSDQDLYGRIEEGGLGLKPLQMKRIR